MGGRGEQRERRGGGGVGQSEKESEEGRAERDKGIMLKQLVEPHN